MGQSSHLGSTGNVKLEHSRKKVKTSGVFAFFTHVVSRWRGSCSELSPEFAELIEHIEVYNVSSFHRKFTPEEHKGHMGKKMAGRAGPLTCPALGRIFENSTCFAMLGLA